MNLVRLILFSLLMIPMNSWSQSNPSVGLSLSTYNENTETFSIPLNEARNLEYWARRGVMMQMPKISLIKLNEQIAQAKIRSDSFQMSLQKENFEISTKFDSLEIKHEELDLLYQDITDKNSKLDKKLEIQTEKSDKYRRQRNTAWLIIVGETLIVGLAAGLIIGI